MHRSLFIIPVVALVILSQLSSHADTFAVSVQDEHVPIRLKAVTFVPDADTTPAISSSLSIDTYPDGQRGYYLVQFAGPIQQAWKDQIVSLGAELMAYIPEYAFKVRMTPALADVIKRQPNVKWVGIFQPAYKLSPRLVRSRDARLYKVWLESGVDNNAEALAEISVSGAQVLRRDGRTMLVLADSTQIDSIARILDVAWIENFTFYDKHNEYGAGVIMGANVAYSFGYDGSGQTVAVADTGLGGGTPATAHVDIPASRITALQNFTLADAPGCYTVIGNGIQDADSGHGTHTAVSAVGDGRPSGRGRGTAPAANLVFQAVEEYLDFTGPCIGNPDGYYLAGIPLDLADLYQPAYDAGARVHSNSWGSNVAGDYTLDSAATDSFIWDNPDMTITFSAGNAGIDANGDGVVDVDSMGAPATAKNAIAVGASENDRQGDYACDSNLTYIAVSGESCNSQAGANDIFTYNEAWGSDFPVDPIASDPSAGNAEQMAAFSSRGPTDDGRIKPDVVAPGTWVLSGYSDLFQQQYDVSVNPQNGVYQYDGWGFPISQHYKYMGGTSMSNPLVAGAAALVRDRYPNVSAALVKAVLINSADDLLDENNDGVDDNAFPIPNVHEGWGRVNLTNAFDLWYSDQTVGLGTGDSFTTFPFTVAAGVPFKVTLVWSDYPSSAAAAANLVNDLDLIVTGPGGVIYRGNVFSGGWSQTGGGADRVNNVENVYIESPGVGLWTVQVSGFNVPYGPQPYALVMDWTYGEPTETPTATSTASATSAATPTASATSTASATATSTETPTASATATPTASATSTSIASASPSASATASVTSSLTTTVSPTATGSSTPTATSTATATASATMTATPVLAPDYFMYFPITVKQAESSDATSIIEFILATLFRIQTSP